MNVGRKGCRHRRRRALQERAFAALYGPGAAVYDRFTDWLFLGEWQRWQASVLPHLPTTGLVIELGAGTGRFAERAATSERRWLALDIAPSMLAVAARRVERAAYVAADASALPVAEASADAVVATFPTRYIFEPGVDAEIRRVLKPDGCVIVVLAAELAPHGWRRRWRRRALAWFYGRNHGPVELPTGGLWRNGTLNRVETAHGWADLYVGMPNRGEPG